MSLKTYGPEEKLLWGICFDYSGATFGFEHRKFGLRALCEPNKLDSPLLQEVLGKARALTDIAEVYLKSGFVAAQLNGNCFTVQNLFPRLDALPVSSRACGGSLFDSTAAASNAQNEECYRNRIRPGTAAA